MAEIDGSRLAAKYEAWDTLPDGYREQAARVAGGQCIAELVGVLPYAEWLDRAPSYARAQMLMAKVQDEVGHGHVMARVCEDLGTSRETLLEGFLDGRQKLLNVFHYHYVSWEELACGALLGNSAAIVQFQSLKHGTYLPYVRALRKIEKEESFHYHHALDLIHELMTAGSPAQQAAVREHCDTWLRRNLAYFGPSDTARIADNPVYRFGIKVDSNDVLRQRWLTKMIPVLAKLGITFAPELVRYDEKRDEWIYEEQDWVAVKRIIKEGGPALADWKQHIAGSLERNQAYRSAAQGRAA